MANAQILAMATPEQIQTRINSSKSPLTVVNFWATWCGPCVKELPYFEDAHNQEGVSVLLISMDFPEEHNKVAKFLDKKSLTLPGVHLDTKDYDTFMRQIDDQWSGAIPATLFIRADGKRYFHEGAFTQESLNSTIAKYLK